MLQIYCTDAHLDLVSEGINRNEDINRIMLDIIDYAVEHKADHFVFGGDWNMSSKPSIESLKMLMEWWHILNQSNIKTSWLIGNHDVIYERGKRHNLDHLIGLTNTHFKSINIIDNIEFEYNKEIKVGFLYLPYIAKSRILDLGYDSTLEQYILEQYKSIQFPDDMICCIAFSHLDFEGATQGSEATMIKGKKIDLPKEIIDDPRIKYIINGHYHSYQESGKVICPGTFECHNFGERLDEKRFLEIHY